MAESGSPAAMSGPEAAGWLYLRPGAVPERLRERTVSVSMVPLLPGEIRELLGGMSARVTADFAEERLMHLIARGRSTREISQELHLSHRSVQRRVASLRGRFDVESTARLASLLAQLGWGAWPENDAR
jgi:DNA-binding CsgD family transcriptional regulator